MNSSFAVVSDDSGLEDHPHEDWRNWWKTKMDDASLSKNALDFTAALMDAGIKRECLHIARSARIYERLVVFMFLHLVFYRGTVELRNLRTDVLYTAQATWASWTEYQLLTSHHIVRDTILQCSQTFSTDRALFGIKPRCMIELDISDIQSKILSSLNDQSEKKAFYHISLDNPTPMLNLLQELLDRCEPLCENNGLLSRAVARLSKRSGCYHDCLILSDIQRTGEHPVAGGGFAGVWRGSCGGNPVALKALRIFDKSSREAALKEFSHEATMWRQLVHPNILPFYGVFKGDDSFDRLCLVSPWMDAGIAPKYLATHPNADRVSLLADVAKGLDYLHSFATPIVHGDLKGANIFVTSTLTACLGDFGLSLFKDSVDSTLGSTTEAAMVIPDDPAEKLTVIHLDVYVLRPSPL
ncbi:kinase-like protein [Rickenella mellea]|uniref:Kinase-like protein n=1 Tax=Rickenella mellea TaxID=50990 RepID=A0A4Y7PQ66_9AGAM|nr:kinase-like protein [Rickenella mellea]